MIKKFFKDNKIKGVLNFNKDNFPIVILFEGKEYEIRWTYKGNLYLRGYDPENRRDIPESIDTV